MDLSIFKIGGWNSLQPMNHNLLEEFIDENEPWLLIGIPSRDPFLVTQYLERHSVSSNQHMKKLMSLRDGLHVMRQCHMRQHFADRYWLHDQQGRHASWREPDHALRTGTCMQMEHSEDATITKCLHTQKNRPLFIKNWRIKIALESHFEEHAKEVWERNWMNLEMQTMLLNTYHVAEI